MSSSVRAIRLEQTGGPEVLQLQQVELEPLGRQEARIEVAAAGVNFIDIYEREGRYPKQLPFTLGQEGAGRVVELGSDVEGLDVGQRVAWAGPPGAYATEVNVAADRLIPVPDGVSDQDAAAFPLQGITAHYLATASYPVRAGDTVVVHAGAGGVGLLLTQIVTLLGGRVLTTVSDPAGEKGELSRAAGAAAVLSYDDFSSAARDLTDGEGVAAVYDGVGKTTFDGSLDALRRRGTVVLFGGSSGPVPPVDPQRLNAGGSLTLTRPKMQDFVVTRDELLGRAGQVLQWIADGQLTVRIGATYPLADAARAQEDLAARRTTGKLLLIP